MSNTVGIGLLGFGTIGAGVVEGLQQHRTMLARRLGVTPELRHVADLDITSDRGIEIPADILTTDAFAVVESPDTDVIIELIGGTTVARELVLRALEKGKAVVTANKKLLAEHGQEIYQAAERFKGDIYFGASVGGGIPIVRAFREGLIANNISHVWGILNGTCNYILTRMEEEQLPFDDVLAEAQRLGFAEADPGLDIDGFDTAHKAVILSSLAYDTPIPMSAVSVSGIRDIAPVDLAYARHLGYRIKLLAIIARPHGEDDVEVRVHPALVPESHMLASVNGVFNAVMVRSDLADDTLYYGRGAGRLPTASTVLGDVADVIRNIVSKSPYRLPPIANNEHPVQVKPIAEIVTRYYLRLTVADRPGVLAGVAASLGEHGISIASVLQPDTSEDSKTTTLIITTHRANERAMNRALDVIQDRPDVEARPVRLRIEDD